MNYIKIKIYLKNMLPDYLFNALIKLWRNIFVRVYNIFTRLSKNKNEEIIIGALADPQGYGYLQMLFKYAHIPKQYEYIFKYSKKSKIIVDCGANIGKIIDIARFCNMEVFAFEPNKLAIDLLYKKYDNDTKVHLYPFAVSDQSGISDFYSNQYNTYDQGSTIINQAGKYLGANQGYQVKVVRLFDVIQEDILSKHEKIYLLKLDVEGAEFDILEDIIKNKLYKNIEYIVCETHERFFGKEGDKKLKNIEKIIEQNNIKNIYLDRI